MRTQFKALLVTALLSLMGFKSTDAFAQPRFTYIGETRDLVLEADSPRGAKIQPLVKNAGYTAEEILRLPESVRRHFPSFTPDNMKSSAVIDPKRHYQYIGEAGHTYVDVGANGSRDEGKRLDLIKNGTYRGDQVLKLPASLRGKFVTRLAIVGSVAGAVSGHDSVQASPVRVDTSRGEGPMAIGLEGTNVGAGAKSDIDALLPPTNSGQARRDSTSK